MNKIYKKGFTLVELLVVIAIIGLLATIAVVSLSGARNKGTTGKAVADLRSMVSPVEAYLADPNNSNYPAVAATFAGENFGTGITPATAPTGVTYYYCSETATGGKYYLLAATGLTAGTKPTGLSQTTFTTSGATKCTGGAVAIDCNAATTACFTNTSTAGAFN